MSSSKEQVMAAAAKRFATEEVFLDDDKKVAVTLRELSRPQRDALNAKLWVAGPDGKPQTFNAKEEPDPKGDIWHFKDGVNATDEWLSAGMSPEFTPKELQSDAWPDSLKRTLYNKLMKLNNISVKDAAGN